MDFEDVIKAMSGDGKNEAKSYNQIASEEVAKNYRDLYRAFVTQGFTASEAFELLKLMLGGAYHREG